MSCNIDVAHRYAVFIYSFTINESLVHLGLDVHAGTTTQLSQQQAAALLGYTQTSWDNTSGNEVQPASASKTWAQLTSEEKSAAMVLGYTALTWSTISVSKKTSFASLSVTTGEDHCQITNGFVGYHVCCGIGERRTVCCVTLA